MSNEGFLIMFLLAILAYVAVLVESQNASGQTMDEVIAGRAVRNKRCTEYAKEDYPMRQELDILLSRGIWRTPPATHTMSMDKNTEEAPRRKKRNAVINTDMHWRQNAIPYRIDPTFTDREKNRITTAIKEWTRYTCVRMWQASKVNTDLIYFAKNPYYCESNVGRVEGLQRIQLTHNCTRKSTVAHEIGHALGLQHEHMRADRDKYVEIVWNNIEVGMVYAFDIVPHDDFTSIGPYDYLSIMHYGPTYMSGNGGVTIKTKDPKFQDKIGLTKRVSFHDYMKINHLYKCADHCSKSRKCPEGAFKGKDCKCWCQGSYRFPIKLCGT
ncbi:zinc metalloproteinase nas-13-like [Physella acuta]|uniref:zinc metalloproteinase nas-13-like n=1 Tax=Physella acuta TaxID=109671 RepID=UPI0027DBF2F1|nr:zinc metalloproteinase nas-13-like [Physella acuta]